MRAFKALDPAAQNAAHTAAAEDVYVALAGVHTAPGVVHDQYILLAEDRPLVVHDAVLNDVDDLPGTHRNPVAACTWDRGGSAIPHQSCSPRTDSSCRAISSLSRRGIVSRRGCRRRDVNNLARSMVGAGGRNAF